ncbi:Gfo/Idh/MocA family protein [Aspergillus affinis]|uniref:Gfo/Idh/MocA family protein n=1 Tax=Aspergillus affinis TaxID=1070780 RepID=UPI0022FE01C1|nr:NAD(P)-binding protein [Aspergillus affinis]KAI9034994.1 NAD(P)-binding protein [Aspergillus affinis]
MTQKTLTVGILTTQSLTLYLPLLQSLPYYQIAIIYDVSSKSAIWPKDNTTNASEKTTTSIPQASTPEAVVNHSSVDLVLNFMATSLREKYTLAALSANKHVLVESPVSVSLPSAHRIIDAQRKSRGRVFVASARRYVPCFETFKAEVAGLERIYYARCRNIQGGVTHPTPDANAELRPEPNTATTASSTLAAPTTTTLTTNDIVPAFPMEATNTFHSLLQEAFLGQDLTTERILLSRLLTGPRGCPDLSVMRETLGTPDAVSNIAVNEPFYSAIFHYSGHDPEDPSTSDNAPTQNRTAYMLTYEYGTDAVPRCDAHLAVYGDGKTVTLEYDGATVRVVIEAADETAPGKVSRQETSSSMEQAYTAELEALYKFLVEGREVKTTVMDSMEDLRLFRKIFEQYDRQCGTIRTPLG